MLHIDSKFPELMRQASRWCVLLLLAGLAGLVNLPAAAQTLAFTPPGPVSAVSSLTGSSAPGYAGPVSGLNLQWGQTVKFDAQGDLFIVDYSANVVRVVASGKGSIPALPSVTSPQAGTVYTVAGSGGAGGSSTPLCPNDQPSGGLYYGNGCPATIANLTLTAGNNNPYAGTALDAYGNLYIADSADCQVRVVYAGGSIPGLPSGLIPGNIYAFAGTAGVAGYSGDGSSAQAAQLRAPTDVAVDPSGNVYIADHNNFVVRVVYGGVSLPPGLPSNTAAGAINTLPAGSAPTWSAPVSVATDASGNIYVSDPNTYRVYVYYVAGTVPGLSNLTAGSVYVVAGNGGHSTFGPYGGAATAVTIYTPAQVSFDSTGDLYVADNQSDGYGYIDKIDPSGIVTLIAGNQNGTNCAASTDSYGDGCLATTAAPLAPAGVAAAPDGSIYYTDIGLLHKIDVSTTALSFAGVHGLTSATQVVELSNTGSKPLQLTAIETASPFAQVATGGSSDCSASTSLEPGQSCQLGIAFIPTATGAFSGSVTIASDSTNATGGNNTITLTGTAALATSSTALAVLPTLANVSQPVTLTATIMAPYGDTVAPTGTVNFLNGAASLGTASVTNNAATLTVSTLPAGAYSLTAAYSGDNNYSPSTSYPAAVAVSSQPVPVVVLTATASSVTAGQSVTFTATVTPYSGTTQPTGSVTFTDGQNPLGSAVPLNGSGVATFSISSLPPGANTVYAVYSGDSNFTAATSPGFAVQVQGNALLALEPGVIATIAGTFGVSGFTGNGGSATSTAASLFQPSGVSVDPSGNVYIATSQYVRVVASGNGPIPGISSPVAGYIYNFAGNGNGCVNNGGILSCGDGGPATGAGLDSAAGVWADGFGNVYIADQETGAGLVREVNASGIISTVAGSLNENLSPPNLGDGGPAVSANLVPTAVRTDNRDNLYIADIVNCVIRRVDAETGVITTVAGTQSTCGYSGDGGYAASAQLNSPSDVALDTAGNLFIADSGNNAVRRVDAKTGVITTVAGSGTSGYSGDGGPAIAAALFGPGGVFVDAGGNLYIADTRNSVIRRVDAGTGIITTVAGVAGVTGTSGDGGLATNGNLNSPAGVVLDGSGNLFIADTSDNVIREVTASSSSVSFGSLALGSTTTQTFTVSSTGGQALNLTAINLPGGFIQEASGGTDCSAPMTLNPGQNCELNVSFFPTAATSFSGNVTIASNSANATSGLNSIAVSGSGVANNGTTAQTITFTPPTTATYGQQINLSASASSGLPVTILVSGPGKLIGNTLTVTGVGTITLTAYQFGDNGDTNNPSGYAAATPVQAMIAASPAPLTVTANSFSQAPGLPIPTLTYAITGFVNDDTQATATTGAPALSTKATPTSPFGVYPITITQGTLQTTTSNYTLTFVNGTLAITQGQTQTITFSPLSNVTYGVSPVSLNATASSGLQVVYTVQGPATVTGSGPSALLTITGAGAVAVTATQLGNATYGPATPVTQSLTVAPAALTFTANNLTMAQGANVPQLTYTVSGFVSGDTAATAVSGAPALSTTATSSSPVGTLAPITITQGSMSVSTNYTLTSSSFVNGTLTVVQGTSQTITFGSLANVTYGTPPFILSASASSGLPVSYSVSGPATVVNSGITITGVGTITVTAAQGGNASFSAAVPVQQSFTVAQAPLTITANNATRVNDIPNPSFTYTVTGFVNGDTSTVVSGAPAFTTTATPSSPVGTYPITPSLGSLMAANYTFANFVPGTLTVTSGGPAQDFSMTLSPQQMTIVAGQIQQSTITVSSVNYYQGLLNLSCKSLPANVSCVFTPAALSVATYTNSVGDPVPIQGTLTVNTSSSPVVGSLTPAGRGIRSAAIAGWASLLFGLVFLFPNREQQRRCTRFCQLAIAGLLLIAASSLVACAGGRSSSSSSSNGFAAAGTYIIQVVASDSNGGPSHSLSLVITVR